MNIFSVSFQKLTVIGIWKNIDLIIKELMEEEHTLEDFIEDFFKTAPPLSLHELETETAGFMSFFDIFL